MSGSSTEIHRLLNESTGEHLFTPSVLERDTLTAAGWISEGVALTAPADGMPIYRLFGAATGEHLYTTDTSEIETLVKSGSWTLDFDGDPAFMSAPEYKNQASAPVYRLYNPQTARHHLTTDLNGYTILGQKGWSQEGAAFYGIK